jgi:hypothetical protein
MQKKYGCTAWWLSIAVSCITGAHAFAENAECVVGNDLFDWRNAVSKPSPPEKSAPAIDAPKTNPAIPADTNKLPFRSVGKFLSSVDNEKRYCTAQYVASADLLLTAAHCVRNKNGVWIDRLEFTPANVTRTDGVIRDARCFATKSDWVNSNWFWPSDYAFVLLRKSGLQGFLNLAIDALEQNVTVIGFPLQIEDGSKLYKTVGSFARQDWPGMRNGEAFGVVTHGEPRFGLGLSGGAWIVNPSEDSSSTTNLVAGLSSLADVDEKGRPVNGGAALGTCALQLLEFIRKNCPNPD